jgi:hypothetical protein
MAKRNYRRFALELADDAQGSRLEDVSAGGMRLLSDKVFRIDQVFPTKIGSPEGPISVQARIVRARISRSEGFKYEYGAQLTMATEADKSRMKRFVQHLSESGSVLPEEPDNEDLEELQERIARLQEALEELEDRQASAMEEHKKSSGPFAVGSEADNSAFETSFSFERFAHLTKLGQPMTVTVEDPAAGLVGKRYHLVADALTDPFDFDTLARSLRGMVPRKVIPETLFDFYERKRIDFA